MATSLDERDIRVTATGSSAKPSSAFFSSVVSFTVGVSGKASEVAMEGPGDGEAQRENQGIFLLNLGHLTHICYYVIHLCYVLKQC